ncbi:putative integrase [Paraburkholderia sp. BL27I4N3]|uniref:gamma-mobile-trio integrase GmtZ n=1 Tax=Paraburkholderia sp. BL27I4N3 TaxID=1938805 RepID=UPI000E3A99A1|nr:gamma-mobile-trio protein GmtX [Paraburkholderia sp. BL27I4N3]REE23156.1 putative integrase [Paraburkholderia sp. BL27I4N3]
MNKTQHPDNVYAALLEVAPAGIRERLAAVHALCKERFDAGERDLSVATIGRLMTERGLMNGRGLLNKASTRYQDLIGAWQLHFDREWLGDVAMLPKTHPDAILKDFLANDDIKANRKMSLRAFHDLCRRHHTTGTLDWSVSTIGRLCAEQGVIGAKSLLSPEFKPFKELLAAWADHARPWLTDQKESEMPERRKQKSHDTTLEWVRRDYPDFAEWRDLAVEWIAQAGPGLNQRLAALAAFFKHYLTHKDVPKTPAAFLMRGRALPDFAATACDGNTASAGYNNQIHLFLQWVLLKEFSDVTDHDERVVSPAFRNPLKMLSGTGVPRPDESVRAPLPYGYVHELRHILAAGPNFRDWRFAQTALGAAPGKLGAPGRDWFKVSPEVIDQNDPDCVWRLKKYKDGKEAYQMWSPVRWTALLVKLLLPLRTFQVRVLDSGESDSWACRAGVWNENKHPLAVANRGKAWQQGVLRRSVNDSGRDPVKTLLYINTNKTADQSKSGPNKGYVFPWYIDKDPVGNVFYWLEKLRNWQSKYNPVTQRTSWAELDARHISAKTVAQLAGYPDACFLFRMAEMEGVERRLPISGGNLDAAWLRLLEELEGRLAARNETYANGSRIRLVTRDETGRLGTEFPLHCLRVSLVTALALEGGVPFAILQKLVGHSRLLVTLYYTIPGHARIEATLTEAAERLDAAKEASIQTFLLNTEHERLLETAVCNSASTLASAIPVHPHARNAAGWMPMHHGLCLVGGNTSELEDNRKIGGCYNGGPEIGPNLSLYGPVPGGSRNCVRCRWFVTEPHHLPALAAQFNTIAYHFDDARDKAMIAEEKVQTLRRLKAKAENESSGMPFLQHTELRHAERMWEAAMKRFSDLAEDLVSCWRLIERCKVVLDKGPRDGMQLIIQGSCTDVQMVFEETESELLQLAGVCEQLELYPDLEASKAVIRRSQLLDSALYNEGLPPVFMRLSEEQQLKAGNAFMARLARLVNPENLQLGKRAIISSIDAGDKLYEQLGIDLSELLPIDLHPTPKSIVLASAET